MTQMILEMRVALAAPAKRASAAMLRRLAGFAIAGSGAAVLVAQAARHVAAAAGG
ncbi:hypothetical protein [Burkholderia thailandensis]|uniref:Uncharacterized protein n=2 Tax=Burkholderia thailandensis TaxID=57975 RepID=A0AAW9CXX7_BURTH|nr:hypothetical protein [Burkholderia thailandensis]AHI64533.1 hypothetical protein BTL_976 [Burkholderia thailandensis H0587]AJY27567.1 hypothetical protein BTM_2471 [Burkholderia thailandensis 34]AIP62072.1 hypothetical protein DR62_583 [Burkholderia thailandensis]AOI53438.1 hypothetical protein WI24_03430 [Burkholderia thailandensis]AOJ52443.1 hypothetical protein AQ475_03445 [Burkholderia thailandensis]